MAEINTIIQLRNDTAEKWATEAGQATPLKPGEVAVEIVDGKAKLKIGTAEDSTFGNSEYFGSDVKEAQVYQSEPLSSTDEQDDIAVIEGLIPEGTEIQNGDIAIVKRYIAGNSGAISYTSYVYDSSYADETSGNPGWAATDGNYSASNVFLKNKIELAGSFTSVGNYNQGKTIKGKQIRPIKSCLNYTKALLYPMKIEYQNETFKEIISEEFVSKKFDAMTFREHMRADARDTQGCTEQFRAYVQDSFRGIGRLLDNVLSKSPFAPNTPEYKYLRISLMLNALNSIRAKNRLNSELPSVIVWKLPRSMQSYVRVLLKEFYTEIKLEIIDCHRESFIDDDLIDKLLQPPMEDLEYHEDQQY